MGRPFICQGDRTSHGGVVSAGSPFSDINGKAVARIGDPVTCPKCGPTSIATGDSTIIIDGKPVARDGDVTACGAKLIATQQTTLADFFHANNAGASSITPSATMIGAEILSSGMSKFSQQAPMPADAMAEAAYGNRDQWTAQVGPAAGAPALTAEPVTGRADGHNTVITNDDGSTTTRSGGTLAWRNNNPGNIRAGAFANNHEAIGTGPGGFAIFPDEDTGRNAVGSLLQTASYQNLSISDAIMRYAPPVENDTAAYQNAISSETGLDASRGMGSLSDDELNHVVDAIQHHEGWSAGTVTSTPAASPQR